MLWLSHTPCRSGWPHGVRGTFLVWPEANGAVVTNPNMAKKIAFLIRIGCPDFRSCERITGKLISLLLKEGWSLASHASQHVLTHLRVSDHPVCGASVASRLLLMPQPPLLCKGFNILDESAPLLS